MFMHREGESDGAYLISQASHAWLAWQIAERWGNRDFIRAAPRAETLAAVFLHDSGWLDFDRAPGVDDSGRPRTFDRMPVVEHLEIWRRCVATVAANSRYAARMVAAHFASLANRKSADLLARGNTGGARCVQSFIAEMERMQSSWREALKSDPRYQDFLNGAGWEANLALLSACDRISVFLCASFGSVFKVEAPTADHGTEVIDFARTDNGVWRVQPWPMEGDSIRIHCEAAFMRTTSFSSAEELHRKMAAAPVTRLRFTLARPSAAESAG